MRPVQKAEVLNNFCDESVNQKMLEGLALVQSKLGREYPLVIGGERIFTEKKIKSINPSKKSEVIGYVSSASCADVDKAIEVATKAFNKWKYVDLQARADVLYRAAAIMRKRRFELVALCILESGRNYWEADFDVAFTIETLEYHGRMTQHIQENKHLIPVAPNGDNRMTYIPLGVGAVIPPWNFAFALMTNMVSAAVVAGNTVLMKPSSLTPVIAAFMMEIWEQAGIPAGVINLVPGSGEDIGDHIVTHPDMRFIGFTGSKDVGLRINRLAAETSEKWVKRVILEMGGKNAILVDDEVDDLDEVARSVIIGATSYQGQKCSATSRVIIHEKNYDALAAKIAERAEKLVVGPACENPDLGPVIDTGAFKKITAYIEIGKTEGKLLAGGVADSETGFFVRPTVIGDLAPNSRMAQEEIFGPVISLIKVKSFEEGIEVFNNTQYGLTGAFFSRNREHLEIARRELHCGNLNFNTDSTYSQVGAAPFGGFNMSGTDSKTGSPEYLMLFVQAKTVCELFDPYM